MRLFTVILLAVCGIFATAEAQSSHQVEVAAARGLVINGKVITPENVADALPECLNEKPNVYEHRGYFFEFSKSGVLLPRLKAGGFHLVFPINGVGFDGKLPVSFEGSLKIENLVLSDFGRTSFDDLLAKMKENKMVPVQTTIDPDFSRHLTLGNASITFTRNAAGKLGKFEIFLHD